MRRMTQTRRCRTYHCFGSASRQLYPPAKLHVGLSSGLLESSVMIITRPCDRLRAPKARCRTAAVRCARYLSLKRVRLSTPASIGDATVDVDIDSYHWAIAGQPSHTPLFSYLDPHLRCPVAPREPVVVNCFDRISPSGR